MPITQSIFNGVFLYVRSYYLLDSLYVGGILPIQFLPLVVTHYVGHEIFDSDFRISDFGLCEMDEYDFCYYLYPSF